MGGKSSSSNDAVVNEQKAEAAQAAAKEAARQARLKQGLASIKQAFEGGPTYSTQDQPFNWGSFQPANQAAAAYASANPNSGYTADQFAAKGVPEGWTAVQAVKPGKAGQAGQGATPAVSGRDFSGRDSAAGAYSSMGAVPQAYGVAQGGGGAAQGGAGGAGGGLQWALKDPQGNLHFQGDQFNVPTQVQTGTSGGFDDAFYNKYKQAVLDYYQPQVEDQYKKSRDELTYRLGRSGNIESSAAAQDVADLAKQKAVEDASVRNQADTAAGDLRSKVAGTEQSAISQLYATEDPEVAANTATSAVRDISLSQPNLSPLSTIFNIADIGGANFLQGYNSGQFSKNFQTALANARGNASHIVGTTG